MVEHLAAHLRLHPHAHHMPLELYEVPQQHAQDVQPQQRQPEQHDQAVLPVRDQVAQHMARHDRVHDTDQRNEQRR